MKSPKQIEAEKFFRMPFKEIINRLHLKDNRSLNDLAKESGISRQVLTNIAKRLDLETRTIQEANKLTKNKGENHFLWGRTKETSEIAKNHSKRMKAKNPINDKASAEKRARSFSKTLKGNLLPQEKKFRQILQSYKVEFEAQVPFGRFVLDFFIPKLNLAIEIDTTSKWGKERRRKAEIRDKYFIDKHNIKTLRINKDKLDDKLLIYNILNANNVIL